MFSIASSAAVWGTLLATGLLVWYTAVLAKATVGLRRATDVLADVSQKTYARDAPFVHIDSSAATEDENGRLRIHFRAENRGGSVAVPTHLEVTPHFFHFTHDGDGFPDFQGIEAGATSEYGAESFRPENGPAMVPPRERTSFHVDAGPCPRHLAYLTLVVTWNEGPKSQASADMHRPDAEHE